MANVQIKSEKLTPFGGIFPIMEQFDVLLDQTESNNIVVFLTIQYYCLPLRHE